MSTASQEFGFVHRFVPATAASAETLLLLHGTGGNEDDLLPLGAMLAPGAARLSPRGNVLEHGMPRFFRRLAEGVFDLDDLRLRAQELASFVARAAERYGLKPASLVAVGFSNGANIAAAVMLLHPGLLTRAVLLSPMVPMEPDPRPDLSGTRVWIGAGSLDPIARPLEAERLAALFRGCGATADLRWYETGHTVTPQEITDAREWIAT